MVIWKQLSDEADYMISVKADPEPGNKKRDIYDHPHRKERIK